MPVFLRTRDQGFERDFQSFLNAKRAGADDVTAVVADIISAVRDHGDAALLTLTEKYDRQALTPQTLAFSQAEIDAAIAQVPQAEAQALAMATARIRAYHQKQLPQDAWWQDESGAELGWRWNAVDSAGLYVPGGLASYPSSVLMNAIPAQVAGVKDLVICAPTPDGKANPLVLLAARLAGVKTVYRIGGAQAIAALAFGTETIGKVDKITGPGNIYVATAKRQVFGQVGIDMIAGPSEVLVIADKDNNPDWLALDLLSQAEHDADAQSILITDNADFAAQVTTALEIRLATLERREIAAASWRDHGAVIVVDKIDEAAALSDRIAPEHLQLCLANPQDFAKTIRHAGAIFLGTWTPEALGDYVGGPNHVLPTAGSARFSSGLSVLDFMKRTTLAQISPGAMARIGPAGEILANSESLQAHGLSIRARLDHLNEDKNAP